MNIPANLKYTKDHEWAKVDGKNITVGITDHAQKELGDVAYVELPAVGRTLKSHETFGVVESIKAVSDLYTPVAGKVLEVNTSLNDEPALINSSPYEEGWIMKLEVADPTALSSLMDAAAYKKLLS